MTSNTDFHQVMELKDKYKPAARGVVSQAEASLIGSTLELGQRTDIELQNIRDVAVMLYGQFANSSKDPMKIMELMDAMSGIAGVIDSEKSRRGLPV